jgi:HD-GYP domain-containing protein (c-di-GMP phosphodiesterase class II)
MGLNLDQFIYALSDTVDLVGVDEIMHGKRVGCMAWHCAKEMDFDETRQKRMFQLGLLHDCGVSTTVEHRNLVDELDWEKSQIHCDIGAERMKYFEPLSSFSEPILYHHTQWQTLKTLGVGKEVMQEANLIYLLDRVDYLGQTIPGPNWLSKRNAIHKKVNEFRGTYFQSELVDLFLAASKIEAFWFRLEPFLLNDFIEDQKKQKTQVYIADNEVKTISELFGQIVDAKSPFTAEHSLGTGRLASFMAATSGFGQDVCLKIEAAGLLHDLGKLQIPDRILAKTGHLDGKELNCMQHHSYISYCIINKIDGLEDIATWSVNHHEKLDGTGYPFKRKAAQLDQESRIIAIADIFQALAQDRPYRMARPLDDIISFLVVNAKKGKLDKGLVELVADNRDVCYQKAMSF